MSLLLDALKEAEARKREAGAAAAASAPRGGDDSPSFEIEGSLALAEDVVPAPEADLTVAGAARAAVRPSPGGTPPAAPGANAAAAALLAARAARSQPASSPTPTGGPGLAPTRTASPAANSRGSDRAVAGGAAAAGAAPGDAAARGAAPAPVQAPTSTTPAAAAKRGPLRWLIAAGLLLALVLGGLFMLDTGDDLRVAPGPVPAGATPAPPAVAAAAVPSGAPVTTESQAASRNPASTGPPPLRDAGRDASGRDAAPGATAARDPASASAMGASSRTRTRVNATARAAQGAAADGMAGPRLEITRETAPLQTAWAALQGGDVARAESLYRRVLDAEPGQVDAQLALAVIAQSRGDDESARRGYRRVLESVPDHPRAWGGLADLAGEGEAGAVESRLRQLLGAQPSAPLHFALGNLLARQQRWDDAQVEYFAAASLAPQAPDYAFNVAVALERIGKGAAALPWYNRSLELVAGGRAARFDAAAVRARVGQLQAAPP